MSDATSIALDKRPRRAETAVDTDPQYSRRGIGAIWAAAALPMAALGLGRRPAARGPVPRRGARAVAKALIVS